MADEPQVAESGESVDENVDATGDQDRIEEAGEILAKLSELLKTAEATAAEIDNIQSEANGILDSFKNSQTTASSEVESAKTTAVANLEKSKTVLSEIQARSGEIQAALPLAKESLQNSKEVVQQIGDLHNKSTSHATRIKTLVPKIEEAAQCVEKHELDLAELKTKIEGLLPGATSAGLSKAFQDQKQRFDWPKRIWAGIFVTSIIALALIAGYGAGGLLGNETGVVWQSLFAHLLRRLPLAAPLVWLAYFAGRRYMDAERLQVDYGYKEAISTAFEGYKKQMSDLGDGLDMNSPIATLCNNQLRSIAEHPGNVYRDGHGKDITLATPVGELAQHLGVFTKQLSSIPPTTPWSEALPKILAALSDVLAKRV